MCNTPSKASLHNGLLWFIGYILLLNTFCVEKGSQQRRSDKSTLPYFPLSPAGLLT
jgi:hypothetical protein